MIEFQPWYQAGQQLVRCAGDGGCGALLLDGDIEVHQRLHDRIEEVHRAAHLSSPTG